jgi:prepilin-type N-terminal cleavage/methylation domain-containing protein
MNLKANHGFSLTEMIVSVGIFSVIMAGIYSILYVGNISWSMQDANVNVQRQARLAVDKMSRDLRVATGLSIDQEEGTVSVVFTKNGAPVSYDWTSEAGSTQYQLIRTVNSVPIVMAQDISAFSVTESADNITISVTASVEARGKTIDYTLAANVAKR